MSTLTLLQQDVSTTRSLPEANFQAAVGDDQIIYTVTSPEIVTVTTENHVIQGA